MLVRIGQSHEGADGKPASAESSLVPTPAAGAESLAPTQAIGALPSRLRLRIPTPKWLKTLSAWVLKVACGFAVVAALAIGLLYLRLQFGPLPLSFMVEPIQRVLNDEMPGVQFRVEDAILQLATGGAIELRLTSVRVTEDAGSVVALASRASVQLSLTALRKGRLAPSRIDLLQPRVVLFASDAPSYTLGYGRDLQGRTLSLPSVSSEGAATAQHTDVPKTVTIVRDRIDAVRRVAEMARQMRRRGGAAFYLETLGLKDASLIVSDDGEQTVLQAPIVEISLRHRSRRSIVSAAGTIGTEGTPPFRYELRVEDSERQDRMIVTVNVDGLVPRNLALGALGPPGLGFLEGMDLPIGGSGRFELSRQGDVLGGTLEAALGEGRLHLPWLGKVPLEFSGGEIKAVYEGSERRLVVEPATLRWGGSHATIKGKLEPATAADGREGWRFEAEGMDGILTAEDLGASPLALGTLLVRGTAFPNSGYAEISEFQLTVDRATVSMFGTIAASGNGRVARLDGRIGPMSLNAFKTMWPQRLAPQTRSWVASHIVTGRIRGGSFSVTNQRDRADPRDAPQEPHRALSLSLDVEQVGIEYLKGLPPLEADHAQLTVEGTTATFNVPSALVKVSSGQQLQLQEGRLLVTDVNESLPQARIDARILGPAAAMLDLADRPPLGLLRTAGIDTAGFDGKLDARVAIAFPMHAALTPKDVRIIEGKASVVEGQARKLMGRYTISGAALRAEARDNAIDVNGEVLLEGVLAKLNWRYAMAGDASEAHSLKVRVNLGNSERNQLGIHLADFVSGDVAADLVVRPGTEEGLGIRVTCDLTAAELNLSEVAWSKPPGQRAELRFDVGKRRDGSVVLQNFRLDGDTIGVNGWVALGADNRPIEYFFTDFSLNTVSNLAVQGVLRSDRIWEVKATGPRFDARDVFRGFLTVASPRPVESGPPSQSLGIDLDARIDTVSGVPDTTSTTAADPLLRAVRLRMSRRGHDLQEVDFNARHDNGRPLKASLKTAAGAPRVLVVEAADAGEALKLIGIYRHMRGGEGKLEINLDGAGAAERRGMMNVRRFQVMGDQVVSDVVDAYDAGQPAIQQGVRGRRVIREQIEFDRLRTAFATGHGQLVIEDMEVTGPTLSATLRGTLDYRSRQVQLGGTYTPLSGLNRALSGVPLFGEVLTGPRREGIVAMTFAIQGPMGNPQVIPNPLSLVTPGFLREIFQMAPNNPTVLPGRDPPARSTPQPQTTSSPTETGPSKPRTSPPASTNKRARAKAKPTAPAVSDGWAATTDPRAKQPERN